MARYVAAQRIKHDDQVFLPGEALTGLSAEVLARLDDAEAVTVIANLEPSVKDKVAVWRDFIVEQEMLTDEEASGMAKKDLIALWGSEEETPVMAEETEE